jgi:hypothetical protein
MANFLETLVAEWYQYKEYFVLQNVNVGRRDKGGYDTELDVVAFSPSQKKILHIETSTDSDPWARRQQRYAKKFAAGRRFIPKLLSLETSDGYAFEQIALFVFASNANVRTVGSGKVLSINDFMKQIKTELSAKKVAKAAVPEQFPLVRAIQFAVQFGK